MPGGRIDAGESFIPTLRRELKEELAVDYTGSPKQLMAFQTSITIPTENGRVPLVYVAYEVELPEGTTVKLDPDSAEDSYQWFSPAEAAENLSFKCPADFCKLLLKS